MKNKLLLILSYIIIFFNSNVSGAENNNYLKIGLLAPLSGEYKELGESLLYSLQLALKEINDKKVLIIPRDTGSNDPNKLNIAIDEIKSQGVSVVIGPINNEDFESVKKFNDIQIIFTKANVDVDGNIINKMISNFVKNNKSRSHVFSSMGQINYLSTLKIVDGILGNSSSGILEAPTFKTSTINIGSRQKGRIKAISVIDIPAKSKYIIEALKKIYSKKFKKMIIKTQSPYGLGGASLKAIKILKNTKIDKLNEKIFFDI